MIEAFSDSRPKVQLPGDGRLLSEFAAEIGRHLSHANIFTRSGMAVTINERRDGLREVIGDELRTWAEQHLVCYKLRKFSEDTAAIQIRRTMNTTDATGVLASPQFHAQLRRIERLNAVRMPVRRNDGWIELLREGYDESTAIFTLENGPAVIEMPLLDAKRVIDEILSEFVFADSGRSMAVAISSMLTVFGFGILPARSLRPCFIFLANAEGAGKTLLVKCASVPVLGIAPTGSKPKDEDEMRKILLAAIIEAKPVLLFDNYRGRLASESLEGFLSSQDWAGRILGESRTFSGTNQVVVFITGNGCTVSPDMRRRSLFCELFLEVERAEDRNFKQNLEVPLLVERRTEILSALWSLILDWQRAMEPRPSRSNASFPDWSRIIAGIVEHAGYGCPLEAASIEAAADVDGTDMRGLAAALCNGSAIRTVAFDELVETARAQGLFERIIPPDGQMDNRATAILGRLLRSYDRRIIGNHRFTVDGKGHSRRFRVEKLNQ